MTKKDAMKFLFFHYLNKNKFSFFTGYFAIFKLQFHSTFFCATNLDFSNFDFFNFLCVLILIKKILTKTLKHTETLL